jgi:hypothetical protein
LRRKQARLEQEEQYARSLAEQEWSKVQQAHALANMQQAFEAAGNDMVMSVNMDDSDSLFSSGDMMSPGGHTDAQTLAMMLQEQLDAINNEIRYEISLFLFARR